MEKIENIEQKKKDFSSWWLCENFACGSDLFGVMHTESPRVFIRIRKWLTSDVGFDKFTNEQAEVTFFDPSEKNAANTDMVLRQAFDFLVFQEEMDELNLQELMEFLSK